jgi:polyisoprenoid-binding protein YceI
VRLIATLTRSGGAMVGGLTSLSWILAFAASAATDTALSAQVPNRGNVSGEVAFDGHATLGDFTGRSTAVSGRLDGAPSMQGVQGWVEFPARSLDSGNGKRDRDMLKSLEVDEHPLIRFELIAVAVGMSDGSLAIKGVSREHPFTGWIWRRANGNVRFKGQSPVDLRQHEVGGLSKMLGLLKMDPFITLRVDLTFSR